MQSKERVSKTFLWNAWDPFISFNDRSFIYWKFALQHDFRSREDIYVIAEKLERNDFSLGILFDKKNVILTSFQLEIRVRISNYIWLWKWKEGAVQPSKTSASFEAHATMNQNHLQCISLSILAQCNWLSNWLHLNNSFRTLCVRLKSTLRETLHLEKGKKLCIFSSNTQGAYHSKTVVTSCLRSPSH